METAFVAILSVVLFFAYILPMIVLLIDYFVQVYKSGKITLGNITADLLLHVSLAVFPIINWVYVNEQVKWFSSEKIAYGISKLDFTIIKWKKKEG